MEKNQYTWGNLSDHSFKLNLQHFAEGDDPENPPGDDGDNPEGKETDKDKDKDTKSDTGTDLSPEEQKQLAEADILKDLGASSFKDVKDALKSWQEYQDSQKTEKQKTDDRITTLEQDNTAKDDQIIQLTAELAASKSGVDAENVDDVVALANSYVSDDVTIEQAIQKVVEKYPSFKGEKEKETKVNGVFPRETHTRKTADISDPFAAKLDKYK